MFKRKKENFICEICNSLVAGDGFTNHCPHCLYSKHVDNEPGDRLNTCGGIMKPILVEKNGKKYSLVHKCEKCGIKKINKCQKEDSFEMILQIASTEFYL